MRLHFKGPLSTFFQAILLVFTLINLKLYAQSQASADALASTEVVTSIGITKAQDLNFGSSAPGDGFKVLSPSNDSQAAKFDIRGATNAVYNISLPADGTVYLRNAGGDMIAVNQFQSLPKNTGVLTNTGAQSLSVGATRGAIGSNAALGAYSGSFTVTVTYQ